MDLVSPPAIVRPTSARFGAGNKHRRSFFPRRWCIQTLVAGLACGFSVFCSSAAAAPTDAATAAETKPQSSETDRAGVVQVAGEVKNPGSLQIAAGEQLTLSEAILKAGGLGPWGNGKKVKLMRQTNGVTQTTLVNFDTVIKTGDVQSDPVLVNGDRIYVPKKTIGF